jgi:uncharacterized repeat protein (TIGR03803 family)
VENDKFERRRRLLGALVRDAADNLYGTTDIGGDLACRGGLGCGVVFELNTANQEFVLHSFNGADGELPKSLIGDASGNLYGTTFAGGVSGVGTVFKLDTTDKETVLHSFTGGADGKFPYAVLVRDAAGNLYGTTAFGGAHGYGTVFKLTP